MDGFTLSWVRGAGNCGPAAVREALESVSFGYTGDPEADAEIAEVEEALASCPTDSVPAAIGHLARAARASDAGHDALRETLQILGGHGNGCDCSGNGWAAFRDDVWARFDRLPDTRWLVDDLGRGTAHRDLVAQPRFNFLLGGVFAGDFDQPDGYAPADLTSAEFTWDGECLLVRAETRRARHEVRFQPLDVVHAVVADWLEQECEGRPGTPAHWLAGYSAEVVAAAHALCVEQKQLDELHRVRVQPQLDTLAALHGTLDAATWQSVTRLVAAGWRHGLEELVAAAQAVLTPVG